MKIIRPMTVADSGFTRASSATYYNSSGILSTAANDVARQNFDPISLSAPPVFLQETARTNLDVYSEQFDNGAWTKQACTISANSITAPDSNLTGDTLVESNTNASHGVYQTVNAITGAGTYTISVFAKASTRSVLQIFGTGIAGNPRANFNLSNGTVTADALANASIISVGAGWYRCITTILATGSTEVDFLIQLADTAVRNASYLGDGASGLYVWGAQVELGASVTSYIPTTSTAVTRATDVLGAKGTLLVSNIPETDYTAYSSSTVYAAGTMVRYVASNIHLVYESITGSSSIFTVTIASPGVVTKAAHGLAVNTPISFTTTGALPTGLVVGTVYYVLAPTTDTFTLSATIGGAAINTSGSQSGVHTYTASFNYNQPVTNTTYWLQVGPTNRWKTFDNSITSQASNTSFISDVLYVDGRCDSVALLNINAGSVTITQTDQTDGVVYSKTTSLVDTSGITDWYAYFFEPIIRQTEFAATDLLPYANSIVSITLTDYGNTVLCGGIITGLSKDISYLYNSSHVGTELGVKLGIQDYSVKTQDTFGNYTILERAFRKTADFSVFVESTSVDALQNLLASYRATPVVYIGSPAYNSTVIYGFYKDFSIDITYHTKSVCTISLEGLT